MNNFSVEFMKIDIDTYTEDFSKRFEFFKNKVSFYINSHYKENHNFFIFIYIYNK